MAFNAASRAGGNFDLSAFDHRVVIREETGAREVGVDGQIGTAENRC